MNVFIIAIWVVLIMFWIAFNRTKQSARKDQESIDVGKNMMGSERFNKMGGTKEQSRHHEKNGTETNHSFRHYDKNEERQKRNNRKEFKDSGIVSKDEYDMRDM